jgi:ribosomal protein S20
VILRILEFIFFAGIIAGIGVLVHSIIRDSRVSTPQSKLDRAEQALTQAQRDAQRAAADAAFHEAQNAATKSRADKLRAKLKKESE